MSGTVSYRPAGSSAAWTKLGDVPAGSEVLMTAPPPQPQPGQPSADGAKVSNTTDILTDDTGVQWKLVAGTAAQGNMVQFAPKSSTAWASAGSTSAVTLIEKWKGQCFQTSPNASSYGKPGWWSSTMTNPTTFGAWHDAPGDPSAPPPQPVTGGFTVTQQDGFRDSNGARWEFRGYNINWPAWPNLKANLFAKFGGANMVRIVMDRNTTVANVQGMIQELTGRNVVCIIDYHDAVYSGTIAWYQTFCNAFKSNPLCFQQTPNEPGGNVAQDQINIINACRNAGWTNPIGLEITGGWQFNNVDAVKAACPQNNQIYLSPHNYGNWWRGNMQNTANATGYYSVVTEFGNSTDGSNVDPNGAACVQSIIESQQAHENGAVCWSASNNYHPADNMFGDPQGNSYQIQGQQMKDMRWLD